MPNKKLIVGARGGQNAGARKKAKDAVGKRSDPAYQFCGAYLPVVLHRRAKARAALNGEDVSDLIERALWALMEREPEPKT